MTSSSEPKRDDVLVLVGTRKGGFILSSDASRRQWSVSEPQFNDAPGGSGLSGDIFHMAYDPRDGGTLFAAINSVIWGSEVRSSVDLGKTWKSSSEGLRPSEGDATVSKVWHVEPGVVYAGVEPAALFKSEDGGDTWGEVGDTRGGSRTGAGGASRDSRPGG